MPSSSIEDYLKAIYEIGGEEGRASTSALARRLGVTPASVTGMLQKLAAHDPAWVGYEKHRGAALTEAGRSRALEIIRHHRLIERFLHDTLDLPLDALHDEAERLEHAISETLEDRIAEKLGYPEVDPHGHPIPRKDGTVPQQLEVSLVEVPAGTRAIVSRVPDSNPELLRYLSDLGILPGAALHVVSCGPFDGPILVRVELGVESHALSASVASAIHVQRSDEPEPNHL
jgi:DtxR family Mn-dependent transcriptional regulator